MKKRRNQKGFSLVELIVVVLIMGIITTALAPQVMKWVSTARENTDARVKDNLKSVAQVAVAAYENQGGILVDAEYTVTSGGVVPVGGVTDPNSGMQELIEEHLGEEYPKVQNETGRVFQIEIDSRGAVTVTTVNGTY